MRRLLPVVTLALIAGCSSKPVAPTITSVDAPQSASAGQKITLVIHFVDLDDAANALKVVYPSTMQATTTPLPGAVYTGALISFGLTFPSATPAGPFEIDLSLIDQSGLESAPAKLMVTIQ